ncbi:hypothetical protein BCV69DRAFT_296227 [Microstroma glucosiphilum]|uniref:Uncharacterized protein n=1 Tax=Pseudomicrostroma glucosiphilum TaxID=1684307 RepID=A0A316UF95_9BASI|nr:hypothetical protein BCV69DRAFT_296227 [Pseudomicrostroma glucosiphilum]PWN23919.1 hypothetical protein BCV69DRAFT_296227 [Pseudomicrostroma glucosiphilum]
METPGAGSSRHREVHVLPRNIEQLVVDCLDEGQYQVALTFLDQVLGPTVVPSSEVLRQLFVLASCKPDRIADRGEFARPRRKRKRRGEPEDILPDEVPAQAVAAAFALLLQYTPHLGFAEALLSAITAEVREVNGRGLRARRSQSGDTEEDEREADPLTSGVRLLIEGGAGSVWELLRILNAQSKASKGEWAWHLPSTSHRKKKRGKEAVRPSRPSASSVSAGTFWDALQRSAEDQWASMDLDLDKVDEWRDALDRFRGYQSERCWRIIDLFVSAWKTQGKAAELNGAYVVQKRRQTTRSDLEDLHLVQQLRSRGSRLPLDDAGEALDIVFAGLCNLGAWAEQPRRLQISQESRLRRAEVAARLFLELVRLSQIGALEPSVLVRGIQERFVFASASAWAAFTGVVQKDEHAAKVIDEANLQSLMSGTGKNTRADVGTSKGLVFSSQKELVFRALQEGIASQPISQQPDLKRAQTYEETFIKLHSAQRFNLLLDGQSGAQALKESQSIRAEAAKALASSAPHPAEAPPQEGPLPTSEQHEAQQEHPLEGINHDSLLRKSGRTVRPPVRTGLRKLPTHGMSRGKPPFRKERRSEADGGKSGDFSSSSASASVSPSKDQAELRAGMRQEAMEEEGGSRDPGQAEGKSGSSLDLQVWLLAVAREELHALDGTLSAHDAMRAAAAATSAASEEQ